MSKNIFNSIQVTKPNRNVFDLSHDVKLSLNMGYLVPTLALECVPGDKFNISCDALVRMAPMVSPVMHRMDLYMHYFFVPNRILWPKWEEWITNSKDPLPAFPTVQALATGPQINLKLFDYMGIPKVTTGFAEVDEILSALPFAAYQKIYFDYYRDQNLITPDNFELWRELSDGDNTADWITALRRRAWEHDYFTSALPFAQKGDPVTLPIAGFNNVPVYVDKDPATNDTASMWETTEPDGLTPNGFALAENKLDGGTANSFLYAGTSELDSQAATINDLRRAFRLQEWLEKNARGGSRYVENILVHFGVKSSDKRLQRPEYITGTKSPIVISEVLNTTGETLPQGNMAGHGVAVASGNYGTYFCEEHGYIIGIMSVMPKTAYQQGIPKHFLKFNDPFQYYWPSFANIGEQEVKNNELFAYVGTGNETFGYVPRYSEYKFQNNRVAGDFRDTLDFWHLSRIFDAPPSLNKDFVECNPTNRIFAVTDEEEDKLYAQVLHKIRAVRSMPKFGTPTY